MAQWDGASKGSILGYKIFVSCIKTFGIRPAYVILCFVAMYYVLFLPQKNKAIYQYFRKLNNTPIMSFLNIYRSYFTFGQTLIDKIAIAAGLRDKFTYEFDGIEHLKSVFEAGKGGMLISAHIGNFEIAERFFGDENLDFNINLVTIDAEKGPIKAYLESIMEPSKNKFIYLKEDMSHIFKINEALSHNELVCFTGDRFVDGAKFLTSNLLGHPAKFPAGPYMIASRMKVPAIFVYVMKEKGLHYHLYARVAMVKHRDHQGLLDAYTDNLEQMLKRLSLIHI